MSKKDRTGGVMRDFLVMSNASSWKLRHSKSFLLLSKGQKGVRIVTTVLVLDDSWLTNPTKERKLVRRVGVGYLEIASVMDWSTGYPAADS